jgi:hypothetical protein
MTTPTAKWPDPTPEMLDDPRFNAIWHVIKSWDVNVPHYTGYCGANGNHVRAIFDALFAGTTEGREELQYAIDLLAERKHGHPARSAGHNARLVLERLLAASTWRALQGHFGSLDGDRVTIADCRAHTGDPRIRAWPDRGHQALTISAR